MQRCTWSRPCFIAIPAAILAVGVPLAAHPLLAERALRVRTHNGALVGLGVCTAGIGWWYVHRRHRWMEARLTLTRDLVEGLVGHRSRLVQETHQGWHTGEDRAMERYLH